MKPGIVQIPLLRDHLGSISVVEGPSLLPFDVKRLYFIHGVPAEASRGSHAHRKLEQLLVAVTGSVAVELDDGKITQTFTLSDPRHGLQIPPGYWRTLNNFKPDTVVIVLASMEYQEADYIRNYSEFVSWSLHG
jgi:dTDP-4-dehydrorhamnose 3,5-epimerase-like enzyme